MIGTVKDGQPRSINEEEEEEEIADELALEVTPKRQQRLKRKLFDDHMVRL